MNIFKEKEASTGKEDASLFRAWYPGIGWGFYIGIYSENH